MTTKKPEKPTTQRLIKPREIQEVMNILFELSERHGFGDVKISIFAGSISEISVTFANPEKCKPVSYSLEI